MNVAVLVQGDLVASLQTTPLLAALGAHGVGRVVLAAPPAGAQLAAAIHGVDEVVALPALAPDGRGILAAMAALRRRRLDAVLVCSTRLEERAIAYAAGVGRRVGPGGGPGALLLTTRLRVGPHDNRTAAWLRLGAEIGVAAPPGNGVLDPGEVARRRAESLLLGSGIENGRLLVALAPGDAPAARRWAPERFGHLANHLGHRHGAGAVVLGTAADRALADALLLDIEVPVLDLVGELNALEAAAVAERCDVLVGADCPLLHLAASVGTPTVGIFGPTVGRRRAPFGREHRTVQALDIRGQARTSTVRVDDVLAALEEVLASAARGDAVLEAGTSA